MMPVGMRREEGALLGRAVEIAAFRGAIPSGKPFDQHGFVCGQLSDTFGGERAGPLLRDRQDFIPWLDFGGSCGGTGPHAVYNHPALLLLCRNAKVLEAPAWWLHCRADRRVRLEMPAADGLGAGRM